MMTKNDYQAELVKKAWSDESFKAALMSNPKEVIEREFGMSLPESNEIMILEETSKTKYFVLPANPDVKNSDYELETEKRVNDAVCDW